MGQLTQEVFHVSVPFHEMCNHSLVGFSQEVHKNIQCVNSTMLRKVHSEVLEDVCVEAQYYFRVGKATNGAHTELP